MVNRTVGWLLTSNGMWRTANGGQSWARVLPLKVAVGTDGSSEQAAYMGTERAWLADPNVNGHGAILRTTNGGRSWVQADIPTINVSQVQFLSADVGWALAHVSAATGGQELVDLFGTTDGGWHWTKIAWTSVPGVAGGTIPLCCVKDGLSFANRFTGWLSGGATMGLEPTLYATRNDGKTWRQAALPVSKSLRRAIRHLQLIIGFSHPPTFFGRVGLLPVQFHGTSDVVDFYVSRNDGEKWAPTIPVAVGNAGGTGVWCVLNARTILVADGDRLYRTTDQGQRWTVMPTDLRVTDFTQLDFVSTTLGFAITSSEVWRTTDGGRSWSRRAVPTARG